MMPAAAIRDEALRHNIAEMQLFADRNGALLCPHGKTHMSPELFALQREAGAWGFTAATGHHVRIYRRLGIDRVFLANILAGRADVEFVLAELATDPAFDFYCLVDSPEAVDLLAGAACDAKCPRPIQLLIETGVEGGRAGVRTADAALQLGQRIKEAEPWLSLRGVETFEAIHQTRADARIEANELIDLALIAAHDLAREGLFAPPKILVSAGGSAFLDLCAAKLPDELGGIEVAKVLRPGCYITHDSGLYQRLTHPQGLSVPGLPALEHALEVWGVVLSHPESGLAIVGVGKRDISHDIEPPVPLWRYRPGDEGPLPAEDMTVAELWDQHLSLIARPATLAVGDLIGFGISHPCATFDRWRALPIVDEKYRVNGAVTTLF